MKKERKKSLATLVCVIMILSLLAACASNANNNTSTNTNKGTDTGTQTEEKPTGEEPVKSDPVTITFLIDNNNAALPGYEAVAAIVKKKHNITTEFELRPGGTEGDNIMKTRIATEDLPEISLYNSGSLLQALNPAENFIDLTGEPYMANVLASFKDVVSANGKVYGVPAGSASVGAWLYNKKVYGELGLSVPKTWAELMANNEKIKAAGKTAVIGSFKDTWTSQLIVLADYYNVQAAAPTYAEDYTANKAKYAATPSALRSFEKLEEVHKGGFMNKDLQATTFDAALKMLAEGQGAHYPMLAFALTSINANFPEKMNDIGMFPQPGDSPDSNGYTVWLPAGLYIYNKSKNTDAAKKWFEVFMSPEGIAAYGAKVKAEGPFVIKGAALPDDAYQAVKDMIPFFDEGKTAPALEFLSPIKGPALEQITVEVGSGIVSAGEGAAKYDKDVEKQAQQLGLEGW